MHLLRDSGGRLPSRKVTRETKSSSSETKLDWFPVQLLIVPTKHMTQEELWLSADLLGEMGKLAVDLGCRLCPDGYRIVSNFGQDALQTQLHGHIHVVGGGPLGLYVRNPVGFY